MNARLVGLCCAAAVLCGAVVRTVSGGLSDPGYSLEYWPLLDTQLNRAVILPTADESRPVIACFSNAGLRFYRRTPSGAYVASNLTVLGPGFLSSIRTEDVNGDGLADLCFGYGGNVVSLYVLLQTESGDFVHAPKSPLPAPRLTRDIAVWDMDGDGVRDIIACGTDFVVYYEGLGDGVFAYPRPLVVEGLTGGTLLAAGQSGGRSGEESFLAVARVVSGPTVVSVVARGPDGTFTVEQTLSMYNGVHTLRVVDFEGDGDLDVVAIGRATTTWAQVASRGPEGFTVHPRTTVVGSTSDSGAYLDDLDGDGIIDAIASNSRGLCLMYGTVQDGQAVFEAPIIHGYPRAAVSPAYDLTGDGRKDLFLAGSRGIHVYENDGNRFADSNLVHLIDFNALVFQTMVAPWSEPGRTVLLVNDANVARLRRIVFEQAADGFVVTTSLDPSIVSNGFAYIFADVNADGQADLVTISNNPNGQPVRVSYRIAQGGGVFQAVVNLPDTGFRVVAWEVCDFNGDGADDLVLIGSNSNESALYFGVPGGGLELVGNLGVAASISQIGTGDFDGDGVGDLAIFVLSQIFVRYGNPSGLPGDERRIDVPLGVLRSDFDRRAGVGDLDGDGLDDLTFYGRFGAGQELGVRVLFSGPGRGFEFGPPVLLPIENPKQIRVVDLNGDHRNEIFVFDSNQASVLASTDGIEFRVTDVVPIGFDEPISPVLHDFDQDGLVDLVHSRRQSLSVLFAVRGRVCPGDMDQNGSIDLFDIAIWLGYLGAADPRGDIDGNGVVNYFDLVLILRALTNGCD